MLYRRNCNTLLSSSLQRCYINGVCFAFQLAALWKRRSVICLWEHQLAFKCGKKKEEELGTRWADLGFQVVAHTTHAHTLTHTYIIWDGEKEKPTDGRNGRPSHLSWCRWCVLFLSNNRAASPLLSQEANLLSSINQTQSIDSYLVNRSANELGLDRCGVLKTGERF